MDRAALGVGIGEGAFGVAERDPGLFGFNQPLGLGGVVRKPGERFEMHIVEVPVQHSNDRDADVLATTQNLQFAFEGFVRAWPEQWMWAHKRWG